MARRKFFNARRVKSRVSGGAFFQDLFLGGVLFWLIPTGFFMLVGLFVHTVRAPVNVDYFFLSLLFSLLSRRLFGGLFGLFFLFDLIQTYAPTYHFSFETLMSALPNMLHIDPGYAVFILAAAAGLMVGAGLLATRAHRHFSGRWKAHLLLVCFALLSFTLFRIERVVTFLPEEAGKLVTHPTYSVAKALRRSLFQLEDKVDYVPVLSASDLLDDLVIKAASRPSPGNNIVLVLVESWGLFQDPAYNRLLTKPFQDPALLAGYDIEAGAVPFLGSTVEGEMRELCNIRVNTKYIHPEMLPHRDCLPYQLRQRGYDTVAIHSFSGSLFNRLNWYTAVGFDRMYFRPNLKQMIGNAELCGHLTRGICDYQVFDWIGEQLKAGAETPTFYYFLTLDAHLPAGEPVERLIDVSCGALPASLRDPKICKMVQQHHITFRQAVEMMLEDGARETTFLLVGDHSPPFLSPERRVLWDDKQVPYMVFRPKRAHQVAKSIPAPRSVGQGRRTASTLAPR